MVDRREEIATALRITIDELGILCSGNIEDSAWIVPSIRKDGILNALKLLKSEFMMQIKLTGNKPELLARLLEVGHSSSNFRDLSFAAASNAICATGHTPILIPASTPVMVPTPPLLKQYPTNNSTLSRGQTVPALACAPKIDRFLSKSPKKNTRLSKQPQSTGMSAPPRQHMSCTGLYTSILDELTSCGFGQEEALKGIESAVANGRPVCFDEVMLIVMQSKEVRCIRLFII